MITVKHHEHLMETIRGLSELELQGLMEDIRDYARKNNLTHLLRDKDLQEEISSLEDENGNLADDNERLDREIEDLRAGISDALDDLHAAQDDGVTPEKINEYIDQSIKTLEDL